MLRIDVIDCFKLKYKQLEFRKLLLWSLHRSCFNSSRNFTLCFANKLFKLRNDRSRWATEVAASACCEVSSPPPTSIQELYTPFVAALCLWCASRMFCSPSDRGRAGKTGQRAEGGLGRIWGLVWRDNITRYRRKVLLLTPSEDMLTSQSQMLACHTTLHSTTVADRRAWYWLHYTFARKKIRTWWRSEI